MKKILIILIALAFLTQPVFAKSPNKDYKLPDNAVQISDNVYSLGTTYDKQSNSFVEGYAFVHKKEKAKNGTAKAPKSPACYGFLASGARWKNVENWTVFPGAELDGNFIKNNTASNIAKWETAAGTPNILGAGSIGTGLPGNPNTLDDKNEVSFAHISNSSTIAVTIVWGYFGGPAFNRKLIAWDQIYNTDYSWGGDTLPFNPAKMDFENISTHELGHAIGMDDMYNSSCSTVTMYGYATEGEVIKRDLAPADITGINLLY